MKKFKTKIVLICSCIVFTIACNRDYLEPTPKTSISDATSFSTPERIKGLLLGVYGSLKSGNFYGGRYLIYGDIRGEEFINQTSNLVTGSDVWNQNPTNSATAVERLWAYAYATINNCNIFIDGINNGGKSIISNTLANNYIAEAKLIRALSYYCLLQYYAQPYAKNSGDNPGVPLRLTSIVSPGSSNLERSKVSAVYAQILDDLNFAETNLPLNYTTSSDNTTRAHRNTAIALKTRVYLTMQKYSEVITEANKIVTSNAPFTSSTGVAHSLQADISNVFKTPFTTTESIFSMPMSATTGDNPGTQNQLAFYFSPSSSNGGVGNGEYSLNPVGLVSDTINFRKTDKRRTAFIKTSGAGATLKYWLFKYNLPSPYTDFVPIIRYSEVLLNLAEAKARLTNSIDAQSVALLNTVKTRSDAANSVNVASFNSPTALINSILLERRIEFLGEGLRNNDIVRLLQDFPAKGSASSLNSSQSGYIWPIAATELSLNTKCTDN